jgi:hypothetical protein
MDIADSVIAFFEWFTNFPSFLLAVISSLFTSIVVLLKDFFFWIVESILDLAISILDSFDLSGLVDALGAFGDLPSEIVNILGLIGIGEALAIIGAAILIRFALQLIPFVRLGS